MGCDSPDSNFNNFHFQDGQWWVTSGWDYSYEGPMEELKKKFGDIAPPGFVHNGWRFSLISASNDTWIATPIGMEEELAKQDAEEAQRRKFEQLVNGVDPLEFYERSHA